jgi:endonuclease VIII
MPEGHTLHALAGALDHAFAGRPVAVSSPQERFVEGAALLDGRELHEVTAWGKHLFAEFEGETWLNVHLGLSGKFSVARHHLEPEPDQPLPWPPLRSPSVRLRMLNAEWVADLVGTQFLSVLTPDEVLLVHGRLGPDPLRPAADPEVAWAKLSKSSRTIAELLMDQSVVSGIGNIYRCELLYRHRVDPFRPGREIRHTTWLSIWHDLVALMPLGVASGQVITLQEQVEAATAEMDATGTVRRRPREFYVYKRTGEPCRVCGSKVRTKLVVGRNLFWCGRCQRRR